MRGLEAEFFRYLTNVKESMPAPDLPLAFAEIETGHEQVGAAFLMTTSSDILKGKILIVDDQEVDVLLLKRMLSGAGYVSVTSTMDPREVCELHVKNHYDLILLDLQMPGMDGFQVLEGLKKIATGGYLPVMVITAQPENKLRALKAGARGFVAKPLNFAKALIQIHEMLEVSMLAWGPSP